MSPYEKPSSPTILPTMRRATGCAKGFPLLSRFYVRLLLISCALLATVHLFIVTLPDHSETISRVLNVNEIVNHAGYNKTHPAEDTRESATFVTLARNSELNDLMPSIQAVEDRFNSKFHYDWVFLNNEPFDEKFIKMTTALVSGTARYGIIPKEMWSYPDFIDQDKAADAREFLAEKKLPYAKLESYRHMCRFESGFFFNHELMKEYRYYWRVEPSTKFFCDVDYDVFKFFRENNKKYGFTIALYEFEATVKTLWHHTMDFIRKYPKALHKNNLSEFVSEDGDKYNLCHFWSNFEIADMEFWRGDLYTKYFEFLDQTGGFFYERWGDAPVHSLAATLFLDRDEIHFFDDMGYFHNPHTRCPFPDKAVERRCSCDPDQSFDFHKDSCARRYFDLQGVQYPAPMTQEEKDQLEKEKKEKEAKEGEEAAKKEEERQQRKEAAKKAEEAAKKIEEEEAKKKKPSR